MSVQLVKKSPAFRKTQCLLYSQNPIIGPSLYPLHPVHSHPTCFFKIYFYIILPSTPAQPIGLLPPDCPTKTSHALLFSLYMLHLISSIWTYHPDSI
jgi:hypothetical protein